MKNKVGGHGDSCHQKGTLEEDFVFNPGPKKGIFSSESPIGRYFIKKYFILKKGDEFQIKSPTGKTVNYKIFDRNPL